jgi:hypothetical protein
MDDRTNLVDRLRNPLWEHGDHFQRWQLAKHETQTDMLFAADAIACFITERNDLQATISRLTAELEGMRTALGFCIQNIQGIMDGDDIPSTAVLRLARTALRTPSTPSESATRGTTTGNAQLVSNNGETAAK